MDQSQPQRDYDHTRRVSATSFVLTHWGTNGASWMPAPDRFAITTFGAKDQPGNGERASLCLDELRALFGRFDSLADKDSGRLWSPATFTNNYRNARNVEWLSHLVFDVDHAEPDFAMLRASGCQVFIHTTYRHFSDGPRFRVIIPFLRAVAPEHWPEVWRLGREQLVPNADPQCKSAGAAYWLPSHPPGCQGVFLDLPGPLLAADDLWPFAPPPEPPPPPPRNDVSDGDALQRRSQAMLTGWSAELSGMPPNSGRHSRLLELARAAGGLIDSGCLSEADIINDLYAASESNGLVDEDGERKVRGTIDDGITNGRAAPWTPDDLPDSASWRGDRTTARITTNERVPPPPEAEDGSDAALGAIPTFPVVDLPEALRELVATTTDLGIPPAFTAGAGLAALAIAIGGHVSVEVQVGWFERLVLWLILIGARGSGKSPAMTYAFAPLVRLHRERHGWYQAQRDTWLATRPQERGRPPVDHRLLAEDVSVEALARQLAATEGHAIGLMLDEAIELLNGFGEYKRGKSGDRGRFLRLWTAGDWQYSRVGNTGTEINGVDLLIPHPTVALCGALQPSLADMLGDERDGLRVRWLPCVAQSMRHLGERTDTSVETWDTLLGTLVGLRERERTWRLGPRARARFREYQHRWKQQAQGAETPTVSGALEKADKHLLRYLPVLAEADAPGDAQVVDDVDLIDRAARIMEYHLDSFRALPEPATLVLSHRDAALDTAVQQWAEYLESHGPTTPRDMLSNHVGGVRRQAERDEVQQRYLETYPGAIMEHGPGGKGGRPTTRLLPPRRGRRPANNA